MGEYLDLYVDSNDLSGMLNIAAMMALDIQNSLEAIADLCNEKGNTELNLDTLCGLMRVLASSARAARAKVEHCATVAMKKGVA